MDVMNRGSNQKNAYSRNIFARVVSPRSAHLQISTSAILPIIAACLFGLDDAVVIAFFALAGLFLGLNLVLIEILIAEIYAIVPEQKSSD
jgi:hypothetical protein